MILNLHEMFILDWIHKCRQSSLGGFPVWSIVLGFVSHVLLVPFVLFPFSYLLRIPLVFLIFSPPFKIYIGGELLSKPVHLLRYRSQVFCSPAYCINSRHALWSICHCHQIPSPMLEAFLLSRRRCCCLPVYSDICWGARSLLQEITQHLWILGYHSFDWNETGTMNFYPLCFYPLHYCTFDRVAVGIVDSLVRYQFKINCQYC